MLSLPDELLFIIANSLSFLDRRRLRLVSRRIFAILELTKPKPRPTIIHIPKTAEPDFIKDCEAALTEELEHTRALLINVDNVDIYTRIFPVSFVDSFMKGTDTMRLISRAQTVEYLSLNCGPTVAEWDGLAGYHTHAPLGCLGISGSLAHLTHLECVGFWLRPDDFYFLPTLTHLSLCVPRGASCYTPGQVLRILKVLGCRPSIISFTISLAHDCMPILHMATRQFPNLQTLSFCTEAELWVFGSIWGFEAGRKLLEYADYDFIMSLPWEVHQCLEYISLSLCPVRKELLPRRKRGDRSVGSGSIVVSTSVRELVKSQFRTVYESDVVHATKCLLERYPALKLVGWLVPTCSDSKKVQVCCRIDRSAGGNLEFSCVTDEDPWPETDMDVVFS